MDKLLILFTTISFSLFAQFQVQTITIDEKGVVGQIKKDQILCDRSLNDYQAQGETLEFIQDNVASNGQYCRISANDQNISTLGLASCSALTLVINDEQKECQSDIYLAHNVPDKNNLLISLIQMQEQIEKTQKSLNHAFLVLSFHGPNQNEERMKYEYYSTVCKLLKSLTANKIFIIKSFKKAGTNQKVVGDDLTIYRDEIGVSYWFQRGSLKTGKEKVNIMIEYTDEKGFFIEN
jgi:hypothetical protein